MTDFTALQELASRVIGHVSLIETKLFALKARHKAFPHGDGEVSLGDISVQIQTSASGKDRLAYVLVVRAEVHETLPEEATTPKVLANLEVAYGALYAADDTLGEVSPDEVRGFGFSVAAMAIWPYARAVVSSVLREMNLGNVEPLPTITQRELAEAAASAASEPADETDDADD